MKISIGLTDRDRNAVVAVLNALLADEFVLYAKTRNFHWNVLGLHFHDLHKFFQTQYEQIDDFVDDIAERVRTLGGTPLGSLAEFLKHARLKEASGRLPDARGMVAALLADHEAVVRSLREGVKACERHGDAGTADFLTGLMEEHEKTAWMLRAAAEGR